LISALGTELGEYAQGVPAIFFIINPDTDPPKTYRTNGLECLIFEPRPEAVRELHHNAMLAETWNIRLIQRDRKKTCLAAYRLLLLQFPDILLEGSISASRDNDQQLNLSLSQNRIIQ
jgi:hypothetical protein